MNCIPQTPVDIDADIVMCTKGELAPTPTESTWDDEPFTSPPGSVRRNSQSVRSFCGSLTPPMEDERTKQAGSSLSTALLAFLLRQNR